ncbi:hypothetical protein LXL04_037073 [Taraxacum kok-saghyz]
MVVVGEIWIERRTVSKARAKRNIFPFRLVRGVQNRISGISDIRISDIRKFRIVDFGIRIRIRNFGYPIFGYPIFRIRIRILK